MTRGYGLLAQKESNGSKKQGGRRKAESGGGGGEAEKEGEFTQLLLCALELVVSPSKPRQLKEKEENKIKPNQANYFLHN